MIAFLREDGLDQASAASAAAAARRRVAVPAQIDDAQALSPLATLVQGDVIPQLVSAFARQSRPSLTHHRGLHSMQVVEFANVVLTGDIASADAHVQKLLAHGVGVERIYLHLLAPAARHYGELWAGDDADFVAITVAVWRLQQLMQDYRQIFQGEQPCACTGYQILLSAVPGEQHTFGVAMLSEFFRRAGWSVAGQPVASAKTLVEQVASQWVDVVGLSVAGQEKTKGLGNLIISLRKASANPAVRVMVGGPALQRDRDLVAAVGADGGAVDAAQALQWAWASAVRNKRQQAASSTF